MARRTNKTQLLLALVVAALLAFFLYQRFLGGASEADESLVTDVSPDELSDLLRGGKPGILMFYTTSCPWCTKLLPEMEKAQENFSDHIFVVKMNAEKYPHEAALYNVTGVPTSVLFNSDGEAEAALAGYGPYEDLERILKESGYIP